MTFNSIQTTLYHQFHLHAQRMFAIWFGYVHLNQFFYFSSFEAPLHLRNYTCCFAFQLKGNLPKTQKKSYFYLTEDENVENKLWCIKYNMRNSYWLSSRSGTTRKVNGTSSTIAGSQKS